MRLFFYYILCFELNSNGAEFKEVRRIFPAVSGLSASSKPSNCWQQLVFSGAPTLSYCMKKSYDSALVNPQQYNTIHPPMHCSKTLYDLDTIKLSGEVSKLPSSISDSCCFSSVHFFSSPRDGSAQRQCQCLYLWFCWQRNNGLV